MQVQTSFAGGQSPFAPRLASLPSQKVIMGKATTPAPAPIVPPPPGKRIAAFAALCDAVQAHVAAHPGCTTLDVETGIGASHDRARRALNRMVAHGQLALTVPDSSGKGQKFCYVCAGVAVPDGVTLRDRIYSFVRDNPGTLREPIIREVGRTSGPSALCSLVVSGRLRGELWATGTHYYVILD